MKPVVGIDVAKNEIVICFTEKFYTVKNTHKHISKWFSDYDINQNTVKLVVFEPTGGYEGLLKSYLIEQGIPFCMTHANYVRAYAKACGQLAKTDKGEKSIIHGCNFSREI